MARGARRWGFTAFAAALTAAVSALVLPVGRADAFKPYTHSRTGQSAYNDVVADGRVTIENREYAVNPKLVAALRAWPAHYNAGVIGPDGFPDLIMGQSVIHPEDTGRWLRHLLTRAWQAQDNISEPGTPLNDARDPDYNDAEEGQILAFTYGFLTHAAGDVWAHTLVNELSEGIFPGFLDIVDFSSKTAREIALRHILIEGYIGAATPGFDNDPNESVLGNGDVAPDDTNGIPFAAPVRFIFDTMVSQTSSQPPPTTNRGKVIDFFQVLRNDLAGWASVDPDPIATVVGHFNAFVGKWDRERRPARCDGRDNDGDGRVDEGCGFFEIADFGSPSRDEGASGNCNFGAGYGAGFAVIDFARDLPACIVVMGLSFVGESVGAITGAVADTAALLAKQVLDAYVWEWVNDIDVGLQNWGELGLAVTKGLFDPQTRRNAQNYICRNQGPDIVTAAPASSETNARRRCENGVGVVDTVMFAANDFINQYLLPMLGLPDWFGDIRAALQSLGDLVDDGIASVLGDALPLLSGAINGVTQPIKDWAIGIVEAELTDRFGIPVQDIKQFLEEPTTRIDVTNITIPARSYRILGLFNLNIPTQSLRVLGPTIRATLDGYLGLSSHPPFTPLTTSERFNVNSFKAYRNAVNMAKMLLLDGPTMDAMIADNVGGAYYLYGTTETRSEELSPDPDHPLPGDLLDLVSNVMTTTMPGAPGPADQWLRMIDGDHAWRQDGLPVFTDPGHLPAGEGNFPLFESCLLRKRVFRKVFKDWENDLVSRGGNGNGILDAAENFPDLGDDPTEDPAAPPPPSTIMNIGLPRVVINGQIFVTPATQLAVSVPLASSTIGTRWRVDNSLPFSDLAPGRPFRLGNSINEDGTVSLEYTTEDDCGGGEPSSVEVTVDSTAPEIYFPYQTGATFGPNEVREFSVDVGDGQGVGTDESATRFILNGRVVSTGFAFNIDTSRMRAGTHTLQVLARDLLGNATTKTMTFRVVATHDSIQDFLAAAFARQRITDAKVFAYLQGLLVSAETNHYLGRHAAEWKLLRTFIAELERVRGEIVDLTTAGRLSTYAESIISDESSPQQQFAPGASRRAGSRA